MCRGDPVGPSVIVALMGPPKIISPNSDSLACTIKWLSNSIFKKVPPKTTQIFSTTRVNNKSNLSAIISHSMDDSFSNVTTGHVTPVTLTVCVTYGNLNEKIH